jgi:hypothetical protein
VTPWLPHDTVAQAPRKEPRSVGRGTQKVKQFSGLRRSSGQQLASLFRQNFRPRAFHGQPFLRPVPAAISRPSLVRNPGTRKPATELHKQEISSSQQ